MTPLHRQTFLNRRTFLGSASAGLSAIALASLLDEANSSETSTHRMKSVPSAHHRPKAKRVLMIFCAGACSQLETFDYKPELIKRDGTTFDDIPPVTFQGPSGKLAKPQYRFRPYGQSGKMISDLVPNIGSLVDDIAFVHSLTNKSNTHGPAENFLSTGFILDGFPSIGAWVNYALGAENENLPAFVAIPDPRGVPQASVNNWGAGFLPAENQGTPFNSTKPIRNLRPVGVSDAQNRAARRLLDKLNQRHLQNNPLDGNLSARIASYELAARMQLKVPELTDLNSEPKHLLKMYGADSKNGIKASFAKNCILARRLLEEGVRFVQLFNGAYASGGALNWDGHQNLKKQYDIHGEIMDQSVAALYRDLQQRGLLEDTLVVWCTEFGRMPMFQKGASGRDHNPDGCTAWLGGAGIKKGTSMGATDELGFKAVEEVSSIHDLHATIMHLLGLDHERLTFDHNGVSRRLTDVHGHLLKPILA